MLRASSSISDKFDERSAALDVAAKLAQTSLKQELSGLGINNFRLKCADIYSSLLKMSLAVADAKAKNPKKEKKVTEDKDSNKTPRMRTYTRDFLLHRARNLVEILKKKAEPLISGLAPDLEKKINAAAGAKWPEGVSFDKFGKAVDGLASGLKAGMDNLQGLMLAKTTSPEKLKLFMELEFIAPFVTSKQTEDRKRLLDAFSESWESLLKARAVDWPNWTSFFVEFTGLTQSFEPLVLEEVRVSYLNKARQGSQSLLKKWCKGLFSSIPPCIETQL